MPISTRVDRVELFAYQAVGVKGRTTESYVEAPSSAADGMYWARKEPVSAREAAVAVQLQHQVDWVFLFGIEALAALSTDNVIRHVSPDGTEVYAITGVYPVRQTHELMVHAVFASDEVRTLVDAVIP